MRQSTAENLALAGPLAAAGAQAARSLAAGRGFGEPRLLAGAVLAAVALTALAQGLPDVAGGIGALMVVVAAFLFPWQRLLN